MEAARRWWIPSPSLDKWTCFRASASLRHEQRAKEPSRDRRFPLYCPPKKLGSRTPSTTAGWISRVLTCTEMMYCLLPQMVMLSSSWVRQVWTKPDSLTSARHWGGKDSAADVAGQQDSRTFAHVDTAGLSPASSSGKLSWESDSGAEGLKPVGPTTVPQISSPQNQASGAFPFLAGPQPQSRLSSGRMTCVIAARLWLDQMSS